MVTDEKTPLKLTNLGERMESMMVACNGTGTKVVKNQHPDIVKHQFGVEGGNIPGRRKLTDEQKDTLEEIRKLAPYAVKTLSEILINRKARSADRVRCAEIILERTYGKNPIPLSVSVEDNASIVADIRAELADIKANMIYDARCLEDGELG